MEDRQKTLTSLPTVVHTVTWQQQQDITYLNGKQFEFMLATMLPDIYAIWKSLSVYKINAQVIPPIIKALGDIVYSSKLGEVIVEIRPDPRTGSALVKRVRSVDTRHLDLDALNEC